MHPIIGRDLPSVRHLCIKMKLAAHHPHHLATIAADRPFIVQILAPMVAEALDRRWRDNRPDRAAPGCQRRAWRGLKHEIEMRIRDAGVVDDDEAEMHL